MLDELTPNEKYLIETFRTLKPFEVIQITADSHGEPDTCLVKRSSQIVLRANTTPVFIRTKV